MFLEELTCVEALGITTLLTRFFNFFFHKFYGFMQVVFFYLLYEYRSLVKSSVIRHVTLTLRLITSRHIRLTKAVLFIGCLV